MNHAQTDVQPSHRLSDWPVVLDEQRVEYLILSTQYDGDLLELFRSSPGWKIDFEDRGSVLLKRSQPASRPPIPAKWQV